MAVNGIVLATALWAASPALQSPLQSPTETLANRYLVEFQDPPAAAFNGMADKRGGWVLEPTNPALGGERRLRADRPEVRAYRGYLRLRRDEALRAIEARLGVRLQPRFVYDLATHGVSLELTAAQAREVGKLAGVKRVSAVPVRRPATDAGPAWIGAPQAWAATGTMGEGVVVGVLDSGVNWDHPAFADIGGDGHNHVNPRGRQFGLCSNPQVSCNDKLIGVYEFTTEGQQDGRDVDGHGSHVASTAVGNIRSASINAITTSLNLDVSGVAPHANLISYKVCQADDPNTPEDEGFCLGDGILAALDQAVLDGVDVINYSIGSSPSSNPWNDSDSQAMLNVRNAGILTVVSAGNGGPGADTMTSPANAPWVIAAANITHNRRFVNILEALSGGSAPPPADLSGVGVTGAYGPARIVYAGDFGNALCATGTPELQPTCEAHTGSTNPFPPGTFEGEIVVCDRGTYGRVEKGFNLRAAGAGGYVLANTAAEGEQIVSDDHCLPAVHLGKQKGDLLRAWLAAGGEDLSGRISGQFQELNDAFGDIVSTGSSRGPDRFVPRVIKPDLSAPGSAILAAGVQGSESAFLSGTSMASPHVAGAAALLLAAEPGLTPSQLHSILITTARNDGMRGSDGVSPAGAFDVGAGRTQVADAVRAGLYLNVSGGQFAAADPNLGGNPAALNLPGMVNANCFQSCSFSKTVTALVGGMQWTARIEGPEGIDGSVSPGSFTLAQGQSRTLQISLDVSDPRLLNTAVSAYLALESDDPTLAITRLPIQVDSAVGALPDRFTIQSAQNRGSAMLNLSGLVALPAAEYQALGLALAARTTASLFGDSTPQEPFDDLADGVFFTFVELAADGGVVIASTVPESNGDLDLYVGRDDNSDGLPAPGELICSSTSPDSAESCTIADARGGAYWVMVQNFRRFSSLGRDRSTVVAAALEPGQAGGLVATGPGMTATGQAFPLRLTWDQGEMKAGERWLGAVIPKASRTPGIGALGAIAIELERTAGGGANDPQVLAPGESARFTLASMKAHRGLFIDVPESTTSLTVTTITSAGADLEVAVVREDAVFNPPGVTMVQSLDSPLIEQSISGGATSATTTVSGAALTAGRYYIVPANNDAAAEITVEVTVALGAAGNAITPIQGLWFNPARDGAGFNLNLSGDQLIIEWYTYLEDGTPVWYLAQGPYPPAGDVWSADLLFFNWDGLSAAPTRVGKAVLSFLSPTDLIFSFDLNGTSGSEPYTAIVADLSCATHGSALDNTGLWFIPVTPGFGYSILSLAGQQVHINYLYDGAGFPRWVLGQGPDGNVDLTMSQFSGFCPGCAFAPVDSSAVGSNAVSYFDGSTGEIASLVEFSGAVSGSWNEAGSIANLTPTLSCPPD